MIEISSLSKRFGEFTAVRQLDLVVPAGELFGFLGPNGCRFYTSYAAHESESGDTRSCPNV